MRWASQHSQLNASFSGFTEPVPVVIPRLSRMQRAANKTEYPHIQKLKDPEARSSRAQKCKCCVEHLSSQVAPKGTADDETKRARRRDGTMRKHCLSLRRVPTVTDPLQHRPGSVAPYLLPHDAVVYQNTLRHVTLDRRTSRAETNIKGS